MAVKISGQKFAQKQDIGRISKYLPHYIYQLLRENNNFVMANSEDTTSTKCVQS